MATFTPNVYIGAGPAWADIGANTLVFCSSLIDLATNITVGEYQDGTHIGDGQPGADQCGANHVNNVKFIDTNTMSINGGTPQAINDTNLAQNECTLRYNFADSASVAISSARFYAFDGTTTTNEAVGVDVQAFEQGVRATAWTQINNASVGRGGDNPKQRLNLAGRAAATNHSFFLALSASPESVGAKTAFDFGIALIYS